MGIPLLAHVAEGVARRDVRIAPCCRPRSGVAQHRTPRACAAGAALPRRLQSCRTSASAPAAGAPPAPVRRPQGRKPAGPRRLRASASAPAPSRHAISAPLGTPASPARRRRQSSRASVRARAAREVAGLLRLRPRQRRARPGARAYRASALTRRQSRPRQPRAARRAPRPFGLRGTRAGPAPSSAPGAGARWAARSHHEGLALAVASA